MSTRVQTITKIIEQRQPLAQKIEGVEKNIEFLASALYRLENHRNELVSKVDEPSIIGQLKEIDTSSIQNNISRELDALHKLKKRFSRNTLNIGLDQEYASSCQDRLKLIQNAVNEELVKAEKALGEAKQPTETVKFEVLFYETWKQLASGLEGFLRDISRQVDEYDRDFKEAVDQAIQACKNDTGVPSSLEEIEDRRDEEKSYEIAYNIYLNEIRVHLFQKFLSLDKGLKCSLDRVKSQITEVLVEEGRLGNLAEARGAEFIEAIATLLPAQIFENQPSKLKYGFEILAEFELSYREFVQHRIRKCLDGLTPDKTTLKLSKSPSAQEIMTSLKILQGEAVYQCENALEDLLSEPSKAGFAIVEKFLDHVLRAKGVETEWRIFLNQQRSVIWPEEFELLRERTKLRQDWLVAVESVNQANQSNFMQFIR